MGFLLPSASTRRRFLVQGAAVGFVVLERSVSAQQPATFAGKIHDTRVVSQLPHRYHGWPTICRMADGTLLLACSGGRESHVCPFGRVELMRSHDGGENWSFPETVLDGPIDERDAGVLETRTGAILVTTFTSLAYADTLRSQSRRRTFTPQKLKRWTNAHQRVGEKDRQRALGTWLVRSDDRGVNWSSPVNTLVNSPHGPIQLRDGRLLYAGKELWKSTGRIGVAQSHDDGNSWQWLAQIPTRPGDNPKDYHELHAVETRSGKLVAHIRNHNSRNQREILQSESTDGGAKWSVPHPIGVWGLPSHLLVLKSGHLLMSYGYRRKPFGNQVRVSKDDGKTWSSPVTISDDGPGYDLGYPSTVELNDGQLVTVWYERMSKSPYAVLRQARWTMSDV